MGIAGIGFGWSWLRPSWCQPQVRRGDWRTVARVEGNLSDALAPPLYPEAARIRRGWRVP